MALRLKTIEFSASTTVLTLAAATKRVLTGATQIFIPENTLTFKSCMLEVFVASDAATAASLTAPTLGFSLGVAAESSSALQNPNAVSAEGETWQFSRDVTSYFASNWSGTAMNWYAMFTGTGIATANHAAKITITYQYEESTSNTQIKTIRLPIESTRLNLTASFQTIGSGATQAIPPLKGTYLPETGITIRQMYLDIQAQDGMNATTNFSGITRINAGTQFTFWRSGISTLNSARWCRAFYDFTSLNLTGSSYYSLEMVSSLTSRFSLPGGIITCTYEFNATGSTTIFNSLILGGVDTSGWIGGTTATDQGVWERTIYIEEPDPITIKESGVGLYFIDSGAVTLSVAVTGNTSGQTSVQAYTATAGAIQAGQYSLWHRVDAGGQKRQGLFLRRGKNVYRIVFFSNAAQTGWNLSGQLLLNYTSGRYSGGTGAHTHTCFQYSMSGQTATRVATSNDVVPCPIPETYYYLIGNLQYVACTVGAASDCAFTLQADVLPAENVNGGWMPIYNGMGRTDSVNQAQTLYGAARTAFTRWNGDPDPDRLNIISSRKYRLDSDPLNYAYWGYYYTYNNITFTVSGQCSRYDGDGSGINVDIYRVVSGITVYDEPILTLTTTANGNFTGTWIDNTDTLYASARQTSTKAGRSAKGTAW